MRGQGQELGVVGNALLVDLAEDRRLHAVVEDLLGRTAQGLEGGDVAAENGGEVLAGDETGPHHAAVAKDEALPHFAWIVVASTGVWRVAGRTP